MSLLKQIEQELIIEWQSLQNETDAAIKAIALRAYHVKYKQFKKSQAWHLELQMPLL